MNLNKVDLNLLVAFDALLEECSVTKAAERLCVGQSAMSATLGRLRQLFGDPLLIRDGRQMVSTPAAESLIGPIRAILDQVSATLAGRNEFDPSRDERTFTIITSDYVTYVLLRPLLTSLSDEAPGIKLHIRPITDDFIDEMRRGRVDLLITAQEVISDPGDLAHEVLFKDRYVCAVDGGHPEIKDKITLEQFQNLPYIASCIGKTPSFVETNLDRRGILRNTEITTTFLMVYFLLKGTNLIGLVHERLGREFEKQVDIRLLEPPFDACEITELMLWPHRQTDEPGHSWLRRRLMALARERFGTD